MRVALEQHLFGLFVTLVVLPLCAILFLFLVPYLYLRSYRISGHKPTARITRRSARRETEGNWEQFLK